MPSLDIGCTNIHCKNVSLLKNIFNKRSNKMAHLKTRRTAQIINNYKVFGRWSAHSKSLHQTKYKIKIKQRIRRQACVFKFKGLVFTY